MAYGPTTGSSLVIADVVAPGAPQWVSEVQKNDVLVTVEILIPATDSDGSPMTGLTKLTVATIAIVDVDPFIELSMEAALALPGVQFVDYPLTPAEAGATVKLDVPVVAPFGTAQSFIAACSDS